MKKRFAIVKDWEDTVSAEEECIERIVRGAQSLGLQCDVVDTSYRLLKERTKISQDTHDFVLHIHYCSGKSENVLSFVTLWNPIQFYHDWGYRKSVDTLISNDAFLNSTSQETINQVRRTTFKSTYHYLDDLNFYPSPDTSHFLPQLKNKYKLMYCGINWEKVTGRKGRLEHLLKLLDDHDLIEIYGPKSFQGVVPWEGFKNYKGEIPFDGISMLKAISSAGVALVVSSDNHVKDEIISNRLFEALAAGALIIADQNPAVKRLIGENCLYIDTSDQDKSFIQIVKHLDWIENNKEAALEMASRAQKIFNEKLSVKVCLEMLYQKLPDLKKNLRFLRKPSQPYSLTCFYFLEDDVNLDSNLSIIKRTIQANSGEGHKNIVLIDNTIDEQLLQDIGCEVVKTSLRFKNHRRYGKSLLPLIRKCKTDYFSIVLPGEELYQDHFASIVKKIQEDGSLGGSSDLIVKRPCPPNVSYVGCRWDEFCRFHESAGNFVFKCSLIDESTLATLSQLSGSVGFLFAIKAERLSISRGFSLKKHIEIEKNAEELEVLRDLRIPDWNSLLCFRSLTSDRGIRPLRKFYNEHFNKINKLKKYPLIWSTLKLIFKRYM